jgi:surface antigen
MKNIRTPVAACLICVGLSGCTATTGSNQATGTAVGATGGALAGAVIAHNSGVNPLIGALIGGIAGGVIGAAIGAQLDEQERIAMEAAMQRAAVAKPNQKDRLDISDPVQEIRQEDHYGLRYSWRNLY